MAARIPLFGAHWLGAIFLLVGLCFIVAPRLGATIFGIEADDPTTLAYVRAIGFRDIALALYIFGLAIFASRRALSLVLAGSLVIPACDIVLVLSVAGWSAMPQLLVHLAGGAALATISFLLRRGETG